MRSRPTPDRTAICAGALILTGLAMGGLTALLVRELGVRDERATVASATSDIVQTLQASMARLDDLLARAAHSMGVLRASRSLNTSTSDPQARLYGTEALAPALLSLREFARSRDDEVGFEHSLMYATLVSEAHRDLLGASMSHLLGQSVRVHDEVGGGNVTAAAGRQLYAPILLAGRVQHALETNLALVDALVLPWARPVLQAALQPLRGVHGTGIISALSSSAASHALYFSKPVVRCPPRALEEPCPELHGDWGAVNIRPEVVDPEVLDGWVFAAFAPHSALPEHARQVQGRGVVLSVCMYLNGAFAWASPEITLADCSERPASRSFSEQRAFEHSRNVTVSLRVFTRADVSTSSMVLLPWIAGVSVACFFLVAAVAVDRVSRMTRRAFVASSQRTATFVLLSALLLALSALHDLDKLAATTAQDGPSDGGSASTGHRMAVPVTVGSVSSRASHAGSAAKGPVEGSGDNATATRHSHDAPPPNCAGSGASRPSTSPESGGGTLVVQGAGIHDVRTALSNLRLLSMRMVLLEDFYSTHADRASGRGGESFSVADVLRDAVTIVRDTTGAQHGVRIRTRLLNSAPRMLLTDRDRFVRCLITLLEIMALGTRTQDVEVVVGMAGDEALAEEHVRPPAGAVAPHAASSAATSGAVTPQPRSARSVRSVIANASPIAGRESIFIGLPGPQLTDSSGATRPSRQTTSKVHPAPSQNKTSSHRFDQPLAGPTRPTLALRVFGRSAALKHADIRLVRRAAMRPTFERVVACAQHHHTVELYAVAVFARQTEGSLAFHLEDGAIAAIELSLPASHGGASSNTGGSEDMGGHHESCAGDRGVVDATPTQCDGEAPLMDESSARVLASGPLSYDAQYLPMPIAAWAPIDTSNSHAPLSLAHLAGADHDLPRTRMLRYLHASLPTERRVAVPPHKLPEQRLSQIATVVTSGQLGQHVASATELAVSEQFVQRADTNVPRLASSSQPQVLIPSIRADVMPMPRRWLTVQDVREYLLSVPRPIPGSHIEADSKPTAAGADSSGLPSTSISAAVLDSTQALQSRLAILVVDDNRVNSRLLARMVASIVPRASVCMAADGQQALDQLCARPYHLVLMDLDMPVMDGLEATRRYREWEASAECRAEHDRSVVVCVSARIDTTTAQLRDCGFNAFLGKPTTREDLQLMVAVAATTLRT